MNEMERPAECPCSDYSNVFGDKDTSLRCIYDGLNGKCIKPEDTGTGEVLFTKTIRLKGGRNDSN